jgi:hypothetical protein
MPAGRPSKFTQALADEICSRLEIGEPLAQICRSDHMPDRATVWRWQQVNEEFAQRIACAREDGFDAIALRARLTIRGKTEEEGGESSGDVQRDKAIVETDLKLLAKWDPKRYGDKLAHVGGSEGDAPIKTELKVSFV